MASVNERFKKPALIFNVAWYNVWIPTEKTTRRQAERNKKRSNDGRKEKPLLAEVLEASKALVPEYEGKN